MFDRFFKDLTYEEYVIANDTNTATYKEPVKIKGLRVKGQIKVTHGEDGDTTSCNIVYRTNEKLVVHSKLEGREIMECVPINALSFDTGYLSYVR